MFYSYSKHIMKINFAKEFTRLYMVIFTSLIHSDYPNMVEIKLTCWFESNIFIKRSRQ